MRRAIWYCQWVSTKIVKNLILLSLNLLELVLSGAFFLCSIQRTFILICLALFLLISNESYLHQSMKYSVCSESMHISNADAQTAKMHALC